MTPSRTGFRLAALALCALIGASCAATDSKSDKVSANKDTRALNAVLAAKDLDGKRIGPAAEEHKATLLVVFASWCGPCRNELATLDEIRKAEPRLRIIGLNAYEEWGQRSDEARLRAYLADNAPWLRAVRADDLLPAFGGVSKVPTVFVYDGAGNLVEEFRRSKRSPASKPELEAAIAKAIAGANAG